MEWMASPPLDRSSVFSAMRSGEAEGLRPAETAATPATPLTSLTIQIDWRRSTAVSPAKERGE